MDSFLASILKLRSSKIAYISFGIFLIHQITELYWKNPIIDSYLDDYLFFIVVLGFNRIVLSFLSSSIYFFTKTQLYFSFIACSLCFEVIFPQLSNKHVADYIDVIMYLMGMLSYILIEKTDRRNN